MTTLAATFCDACGAPLRQCDCFEWFCPGCAEHSCLWTGGASMEPLPGICLREYQERAAESVFRELETQKSTLVVMPTGTGKTVVFGYCAHCWPKGRVLVLAHRDELIRQASDKIASIIGEPCEIEKGEEWADQQTMIKSKVIVASVQTISQERRLARFNPFDFGLVVVDEGHHAPAKTYRRVLNHFSKNPSLRILGVTATPDRSDEIALGKVFSSVAFDYDLLDAISDGYLVEPMPRPMVIESVDFSHISASDTDLNEQELAALMEQEKNVQGIAISTVQAAGDRKTLVFAGSVPAAEIMAEITNRIKHGSAEVVHGKLETSHRRNIIERFARDEIQFLYNYGVATEGFDDPGIQVVAIGRPTKSRSLFAQMVGRGTRPLPGIVDGHESSEARRSAIASSRKPVLEVLDFVGNAGEHKLVGVVDILGGRYDDEVVERARKNIEAKPHVPSNVVEELKRAQGQIDEEARKRRQAVVANVKWSSSYVNPFDVMDVSPRREPGWFKGKNPTPRQVEALTRIGVKSPEKLTFFEASQLIEEVIRRRKENKCSYKQAKLLAKFGYATDCSFDEARGIIDKLAANNWRPL